MITFFASRIRKTHPGAVVHLSDNPLDPNKVSKLKFAVYMLLIDVNVTRRGNSLET